MNFRIPIAALALAMMNLASTPAQCSDVGPNLPIQIGIVVAASENAVAAELWLGAAREQGLPVSIVTVDEVMSDWHDDHHRFAALVLPDGLARKASPAFVAGLQQYVENGGRLLVVFDAAILDTEGLYALDRSVLSDLVGINYAMSERLGDRMFREGPVFASSASATTLGIPPGLAIADSKAAAQAPFNLRLRTYGYPELTFPSLVTEGHYDGEPLLEGPDGQIVAGIRSLAKGRVIFANMPLGDMKLNGTNGWPLHRFLRLLAIESGLPVFAMTPGAVGGMVLNIHVDAGAAIAPLQKMVATGFFKDGPFSIHMTAGPDVNKVGDKLGVDVPHNKPVQNMLRNLASQGHEIGSHGGWIHNYWATEVTADSAVRDQHLLELNVGALAAAIGEPIRVYSAPGGQHPAWVTEWLRRHDFLAYYTTANNGSAPTRGYRNGVLEDIGIWSFPIVIRGEAASFEEASVAKLDERSEVTPWLKELTHFTADEHEVRMFYFHPTGVYLYEASLKALIAEAHALHGHFRWYTMAELSRFLDRREATQWSVARRDDVDRLEAESPDSLKDMTWLIPANRYDRPRLVEGAADIARDGPDWVVKATERKKLVIDLALGKGNAMDSRTESRPAE